MRGRTNADAGLQLNATIGSYEVASGENIVAGDFVEQYTYVAGTLSNATTATDTERIVYKDNKLFKLSDGNYIAFGNKTNLYHNNDGEYTKVWTEKNEILSGNNIIKLSNDCFLGNFTVDAKVLKATLVHYKASDNTIEYKDLVSTTEVSNLLTTISPYVWVVKRPNGNYRVFVKFYDQADYIYYSTGILDISGSNYSSYSIDVSSLVAQFTRSDIGSDSSKRDFAFVVRTSSSETYLISVNSGSTFYLTFVSGEFNLYNINNSTLTTLNSKTVGRLVCEDSNIDFYTIATNRTITSLIRQRVYFNPTDPTLFNIYNAETIVSDLANSNMRYLTTVNGYDLFVLYEYNSSPEISQLRLIELNKSTGEIEALQAVEISATSSTASMFVSEFIDNKVLITIGNTLIAFKYVSRNLEAETSTMQKVRGITSQAYIKGVAKQSGTAGETIEVYIPQVSN